jgi:hypothetical protein
MATPLVDTDTQRKLSQVEHALTDEFPDLPGWQVKNEVHAASADLLDQARITAFVPLLVHRVARERLVARLNAEPGGSELAA